MVTFRENILNTIHQYLFKHAISVRFDWLCATPKWAIYHGDNKFHSYIQWNNNGVLCMLDTKMVREPTLILLYKVQCLTKMPQIQILTLMVWPDRDGNSRSTKLGENVITITSPMRFPLKHDIMDEHVRKVFLWNSLSTIIKLTLAWSTLNTFRKLDHGGTLPSSVFYNHVQSLSRIHTLQIKVNMLLSFVCVYWNYHLHRD